VLLLLPLPVLLLLLPVLLLVPLPLLLPMRTHTSAARASRQ
jgi:hypothetical protein